jgi:translation initiation factor 4B
MLDILATERTRLQLKPRSKPKEGDTSSDTTSSAPSSIFGGAKPVDTATREKEIAARLEKENSGKESREVVEGKGGDRRRFKSTGSEDGEKKFEKG